MPSESLALLDNTNTNTNTNRNSIIVTNIRQVHSMFHILVYRYYLYLSLP